MEKVGWKTTYRRPVAGEGEVGVKGFENETKSQYKLSFDAKSWKLYDEWLDKGVEIGKGYEDRFRKLCEGAPPIPPEEAGEWGAYIATTKPREVL